MDLCRADNHFLKLGDQLTHLSHCLLWDPHSAPLLIRRGIARYRVRDLQNAERDFSLAISLPKISRPELLEAKRFRSLVRDTCFKVAEAKADAQYVLEYVPCDPLALAISTNIKASSGDSLGAKRDLQNLENAWPRSMNELSPISEDNRDLIYLTAGWAKSAVGTFIFV